MKSGFIKKKVNKNTCKKVNNSKNMKNLNSCEFTNIVYCAPSQEDCYQNVNTCSKPLSCDEFESKANHLIKQADCAKQQAINLENEAKNLEHKANLLYKEASEFWNEYNKLSLDSDIYFAKAQACYSDTLSPQENNCCPNYCKNNKPLVCCKKQGCLKSEYGK